MKQKNLISVIKAMVPQAEELDFDRIGKIRSASRLIQKVGFCVDLTKYVMEQVREKGIDYLVIHHGHGKLVKQQVDKLGIGAYGLHLVLDTMDNGLIDSFADLFGMKEVKPIEFVYKGKKVPKGAVIGKVESRLSYEVVGEYTPYPSIQAMFKQEPKYERSCFTPTLDFYLKRINNSLGKELSQVNLGVVSGKQSILNDVVVSTGPAIRKEFMEQISDPYELFIAGSIKDGAAEYAREKGITLITVGDFESHYHGAKKFVEKLAAKTGLDVELIPNYKIK